MKTVLPLAILFLGIGFVLGRWSVPSPVAPPASSAAERAYAGLGRDAFAFLNWYGVNGGADQIEPKVLHDNVLILQSKAVGYGITMDKGILTPPEANK